MEIWKSIKEYRGIYSISTFGRVRKDRKGNGPTWIGKILKPQINSRGYYHVRLYKKGIQSTIRIHSLVAKAFLKKDRIRKFVNHKDGNKFNNNMTNLEYMTTSENHRHAFRNGFRISVKGSQHNQAKLTEKQVIEMREKHKTGNYKYRELSKIYKINESTAWQIINYQRWKHV